MKKVRRFQVARIPAFACYGVAAFCVAATFTKGIHCLFMAMVWYVIGMMVDPKTDEE